MSQVLQTAAGVATPLAFLAMVGSFVYFAYTRKLKHEERRLQTLPDNKRAAAIDEYLTRYGIQGKDLNRADRFSLIHNELQHRHRRSTSLLYLAAMAFVLCFGMAVYAYVAESKPNNSKPVPDNAALIDELNERANVVLKTMNGKKTTFEDQQEEGAPTGDQIAIISEAIDQFELLHKEYVQSLRDNNQPLSHERLGKVKDLLSDKSLLAALNLVFKPHYQTITGGGAAEPVQTLTGQRQVCVS